VKGDSSELDGLFVGEAANEKAAVKINIEVTDRAAQFSVGAIGKQGRVKVTSADSKVRYFQRQVIELVRSEAHRHRAVSPNLKGNPPRKRSKPIPVTCPDCGGYRSFDCDTCEGSGVVPG